MKQVPIPDSNAIVELYIYDCAGQSIFNQLEMNSKYVRYFFIVCLIYFHLWFYFLLFSLVIVSNVSSIDGTNGRTNVQYDNASAVVVVYDVAQRDTLQGVNKWVQGTD